MATLTIWKKQTAFRIKYREFQLRLSLNIMVINWQKIKTIDPNKVDSKRTLRKKCFYIKNFAKYRLLDKGL